MSGARRIQVFSALLLICGVALSCLIKVRSQELGPDAGQMQAPSASPVPSPLPTPTPIQPTNLHQWGSVTLFHGLPSNRVRAIAEGPDRRLWFGTDAGLARYDGRRTQVLSADGLPSGRVLALKFDEDGVLWIGTERGASRFFQGSFRRVPDTDEKTITAIITPSRGRAVLATADGQLFECDGPGSGRLEVTHRPSEPLRNSDSEHREPLYITSLAADGDRIVAGTRGRGIVLFENGNPREMELKPRSFFIEAVNVDQKGMIEFGTVAKGDTNGLFRIRELLRAEGGDLPTGTVTAFANGDNGDMWVASDGHGAFHIDNDKTTHFSFDGTAGGLQSDHIYAICIDREGVIWFGTDRGVCRYDPHAARTENISDDRESNFIRSLYRTRNGLLLAGTNRGLFAFDERNKSWHSIESLAHSAVYDFSEDATGRLLIGAANGLFVSDNPPKTISDVHLTNIVSGAGGVDGEGSVRSIVEYNGLTYIAVYGRGLQILNGHNISRVWPVNDSDPELKNAIALFCDGTSLWIGTASKGVFRFDGSNTTREFDEKQTGAVRSMISDREGRLWMATANGLFAVNDGVETPVYSGVDTRDLALAPQVDSPLSKTLNPVWCATVGSGVVKAAFIQGVGPVTSKLDAEQGLPSQNTFAVLLSPDENNGELLIGSNRGLARFAPSAAKPALGITQVVGRRLYSPSEVRGGLTLEYPQNSLLVNVLAISSRTFPEQFQYAFRLFDQQGNIIRERVSHDAQFEFETLPPGAYRLEAVAFSRDLAPSEAVGFTLNVGKAPFPWTSSALGLLLGLSLVALAWGYYQNRRIRQTSSDLMIANHDLAAARMNLANEAEAERRRIARDLHDQTLADLRNLLMLTDRLPMGTADEADSFGPATLRGELESVSNEIRRICEDLSPSALENVGLGAALEWALVNAATHAPRDRRFDYKVECEEDLEERTHFASGVRMQIYRIAQEVINNICKHAAASLVVLDARTDSDGGFTLKIENDGNEFHPGKSRKGRGLTNILSRASMIEANVDWEKIPGGGMRFTLQRPRSTTATNGQPQL